MDWISAYCMSKAAATTDYQPEWEAERYFVGDKMFAMIGTLEKEDNRPIITLKCDPPEGEALRQEYEDIIPGYYMNKQHWITIFLDSDTVPKEVIEHCIDVAYDLILAGLTKKKKREVLGEIEAEEQGQ